MDLALERCIQKAGQLNDWGKEDNTAKRAQTGGLQHTVKTNEL